MNMAEFIVDNLVYHNLWVNGTEIRKPVFAQLQIAAHLCPQTSDFKYMLQNTKDVDILHKTFRGNSRKRCVKVVSTATFIKMMNLHKTSEIADVETKDSELDGDKKLAVKKPRAKQAPVEVKYFVYEEKTR